MATRFWEHLIRDQEDFNRHADYIHWNPVKHGWVRRVADWPHSSFTIACVAGFTDGLVWSDGRDGGRGVTRWARWARSMRFVPHRILRN